ncbi:MAG: hypothetical protein IK077_02090 [Thermoguttaceae bacterium]|nr:hypothetical protein [Thermoguttaceae bacterium]
MTEETTKRNTKDSVFVDLFSDESYVFRLYKDLHPEDKDAKIEDIEIRTLESTFVNTLCNDLGFTVGNKLIMLVEAQSDWCENIPLRMFFYVSATCRRYIDDLGLDEHDSAALKLPPVECYVVYTGPKDVPKKLSLKEKCFGGLGSLDLEITVLDTIDGTIYGEYIGFCKVFNEQRIIYGRSVRCIQETIRICIEKGYLAEYFQKHKNEVITMVQRLFDEEVQRERYNKSVEKKSLAKGRLEEKKDVAKKLRLEGWAVERIAKFIEIPVVDVEIWLGEE